ncbi:hypothetical protein ACA910_012633 [Epithemia clementina (nom. ined.)]
MSSTGNAPTNFSSDEVSTILRSAKLLEKRAELQEEAKQLKELLEESTGVDEMEKECRDEMNRNSEEMIMLEKKILDAILPRDEDDFSSDAIIEVRAGTGGDEASLFAYELFEAYHSIAKSIGFKVEVLDDSRSEIGGLRDGSILVSGGALFQMAEEGEDKDSATLIGPYGTFKFESGVHRVQRVPINSTRIQTSACSVAVMPSQNAGTNNQYEPLPVSELKIESMRSSGAGGQHVNTTNSAIRITHLPTGITASIQDERSQQRNKDKALTLITARVRDMQRATAEKERGETRSTLMGGGDRSERIRTYNYAQDRITDHRCKESRKGIESLLSAKSQDNLVVAFLPHMLQLQREELLSKVEKGSK